MDFPNDIATNDDIKEIDWAFYTKGRANKAGFHQDPIDADEIDELEQLHFAECTLRECGKHVLLEHNSGVAGIWVFSLSKAEKDGAPQILSSFGLSCSKAGTIQAEGLNGAFSQGGIAKRPDNTSRIQRGPQEMNTHAFGANSRPALHGMSQSVGNSPTDTSHSRQDLFIAQLYPRIVAAISQSLCRSLAGHKEFMQVGPRTWIETRTIGDTKAEDLVLSRASSTTSTLFLDVKWLPAGTLLISYSRESLLRLYKIPYVLAHSEKKLSRDTPLLLSPSGVTARFSGIEDSSRKDPLYGSNMKVKSLASSRLARSGISLPHDTQWLRVFIDHTSCEDRIRQVQRPGFPITTLWPAHLCLCEDAIAADEYQAIHRLKSSGDVGTMDALATAETWYLGRARRKTSELQRQKLELEVQQVKVTQASDDEDALSNPGLQTNQYMAPQDMSGIYPTPPDGIPTNVNYSSPTNNPLSAGLEIGENTGSTPGALSRPYDEQGNKDLFGEMDIDMFAANGLTEADFSFFDEPNDEEMQEPHKLLAGNELEAKAMKEPAQEVVPSRDSIDYFMPKKRDDCVEEVTIAKDDEPTFGRLDSEIVPEDIILTQKTSIFDVQSNENNVVIGKKEEIDVVDFDTKIVDEALSRQPTSFDAVHFQGKSIAFDGKYALRGRYGFGTIDPPLTSKPGEQVPSREGVHPQLDMSRATESPSDDEINITSHTDEELSVESPTTTNEHTEALAKSQQQVQRQLSRKRKRDDSEHSSLLATPASPASAAQDLVELPNKTLALPPLDLFSPRAINQTKTQPAIESKTSPSRVPPFVGNDHVFMKVALMVLDQAVSGSSIIQDSLECTPKQTFAARQETNHHIEKVVAMLSSGCGKISKRCTIRDYAGLGDKDTANGTWEQMASPQGQKMYRPPYPTRPPSLDAVQFLFKLQTPYTCVRRNGISIDVSASSLRFWEELSLAPAHDSKNVTAFCIYPDSEHAHSGVATFLNMIKGAYQSCNLGSHDLGADLSQYVDGRVPFSNDESAGLALDLNDECKLLGTRLGKLGLQGGNTVIYMVDSSDPERVYPTLCAAFLKLFEAYNIALSETPVDEPNDLILQILSSHLLFFVNSTPIPTPTDYRRLAFEVYDRCGPNQGGAHRKYPQYLSVPAIRLAKSIPKAIDLRLTPENSTPHLQSDNCIHIAYVWSPGDHWLTASWVDNHGILSWNACFCFGEEDETPWDSFADIVREIWAATSEMITTGHSPWRLLICKDCPVDKRELDAWQRLLLDIKKPQISVTILTIDTNPSLDFPLQEYTYRFLELPSGLLATPEKTPQSNAASPDIAGFGTTPGGAAQASTPPPSTSFSDHDVEARLVDVTNESWGVIVSSTLQNYPLSNPAVSSTCPAVASAYLMKRAGPRDEDGVLKIAVNIIHGPTGHKAMLKEILAMYSGLALLARVRAMRESEAAKLVECVLPYHIIAAKRGHAAVSATMRYGEG